LSTGLESKQTSKTANKRHETKQANEANKQANKQPSKQTEKQTNKRDSNSPCCLLLLRSCFYGTICNTTAFLLLCYNTIQLQYNPTVRSTIKVKVEAVPLIKQTSKPASHDLTSTATATDPTWVQQQQAAETTTTTRNSVETV
jgi:hypothetical protein